MTSPVTPQLLIAKSKRADLIERAACQERLIDLCRLLNHPTPAAADPPGEFFTLERGFEKDEGELKIGRRPNHNSQRSRWSN